MHPAGVMRAILLLCFRPFWLRQHLSRSHGSGRSRCRRIHLIICANSCAALCRLRLLAGSARTLKLTHLAGQTRAARVSRGNSNRQSRRAGRGRGEGKQPSAVAAEKSSCIAGQIRDESGVEVSFVLLLLRLAGRSSVTSPGKPPALIEGEAIIKMFPLCRLVSPHPALHPRVDYEKLARQTFALPEVSRVPHCREQLAPRILSQPLRH
jgi:hypothetical protein